MLRSVNKSQKDISKAGLNFRVVAFFFIVFDDTLTATVCAECYESLRKIFHVAEVFPSLTPVGRIMISADGRVLQVVWRDAEPSTSIISPIELGVKSGTDMKHYRARRKHSGFVEKRVSVLNLTQIESH